MPEAEAGRALELLRAGTAALGLDCEESGLRRMVDYLDLMVRWNRAYNLTSVRDPGDMVTRHLLDSLAVAGHLRGRRIADVGSGAGLPGIPLAIVLPGREFHLADSNGKKTRFLFQVKTALALDNMHIHQGRAEDWRPEPLFDAVVTRAFASLAGMVRACRHLLRPGGRLVAMKGARPDAELEECAGQCRLLRLIELQVPGLGEQRHLVELEPL